MSNPRWYRRLSLVMLLVVVAVIIKPGPNTLTGTSAPPPVSAEATALEMDPFSYFPLVMHGTLEDGIYGMQYYDEALENAGVKLAPIGVKWARDYFGWRSAEPQNVEPSGYNWSTFDSKISYAQQLGIELIFNINIPPGWAQNPATGRIAVEYHPEFADFMAAAVERYDGDGYLDAPGSPIVTYYEIINEPDEASEYSPYGYNYGYAPEEYAALLKTIYPAMKAADPGAQVVMGGVAMDWFVEEDPYGNGHFARDFVENLFQACEGYNCFDVVNYHAYPELEGRWLQYGKALYGKGVYIQSLMDTYGIGDLPMMVTETRWGSKASYGGDQAQCRFVIKLYTRGMALDMVTVIWFRSDDNDAPLLPGFLDTNYDRKPSSYTVELLNDRLRGADFERALTATDMGYASMEGYRFSNVHNKTVDVLWVMDDAYADYAGETSYPVTFQASRVTVYNTWDLTVTTIYDGDDGSTDGQVIVMVGYDPLIVEYE